MSTPFAPAQYSQTDQNEARAELTREIERRHKRGADIELSSDRLILRSPNGSRFAVAVDNAGALSTVAV